LRTPPCLSNQPSIVGRPCIAKACVCCKAVRHLARNEQEAEFTAVATRKRLKEIITIQ
jgi:hypothetical protein